MSWNPKYKVDLRTVFDKTYRGEERELRDRLRPIISRPEFKEAFSQALIQTIVDRTLSGKDKRGSDFPGYSKSYIKSEDFEIYGKSPSDVNLELTGSMLADLTFKPVGATAVEIFLESTENRAKAQGHITGNLGGNKSSKFKRDFLGATDKELTEIMRDVVSIQAQGDLNNLLDLVDVQTEQEFFQFDEQEFFDDE